VKKGYEFTDLFTATNTAGNKIATSDKKEGKKQKRKN